MSSAALRPPVGDEKPSDVFLEAALLALGRDLVNDQSSWVLGLVDITRLARYAQDTAQFPVVEVTPFGVEFFRAVMLSDPNAAGSHNQDSLS